MYFLNPVFRVFFLTRPYLNIHYTHYPLLLCEGHNLYCAPFVDQLNNNCPVCLFVSVLHTLQLKVLPVVVFKQKQMNYKKEKESKEPLAWAISAEQVVLGPYSTLRIQQNCNTDLLMSLFYTIVSLNSPAKSPLAQTTKLSLNSRNF